MCLLANLYKLKKILRLKCKRINLIITDVDGVLTDGGRYYSKKGEELKKFHVHDGMGVNLLLRNNIKTIIVTKENSKITKCWAKDMKIAKVFAGVTHKEKILPKICQLYDVTPTEVVYIGDDVNDIELMNKVGMSVSPFDGIAQAKKIADYVCTKSAGNGVLREVADLILKEKFPKKTNWY